MPRFQQQSGDRFTDFSNKQGNRSAESIVRERGENLCYLLTLKYHFTAFIGGWFMTGSFDQLWSHLTFSREQHSHDWALNIYSVIKSKLKFSLLDG